MLVQEQNTLLNNYSDVNAQGRVPEAGAVALEGGILEAVAFHIHRSSNQGVMEEHIQDTRRVPHQSLQEVNNSRTGTACIQAAALVGMVGTAGPPRVEAPLGELLG